MLGTTAGRYRVDAEISAGGNAARRAQRRPLSAR